jgi:lipoprotein-anchoring transpeptidase ErfK/SrfK
MTDDELEDLVSGAFAAKARAEIGDQRHVPPLALDRPARARHQHRVIRWVAPLAAAAAVVGVVVGANSLGGGSPHHVAPPRAGGEPTSPASSPSRTASAPVVTPPSRTPSAQPTAAVNVRLSLTDGAQVGVGMPVIAEFSKRFTSAASLARATQVTVNGQRVSAAWYFVATPGGPGSAIGQDPTQGPIQGHLRMQHYWPAHAKITVSLPVAGQSAGPGLVFADSAAVSFTTGPANLAVVDNTTHTMRVTSDGHLVAKVPVSLGSPATPTDDGIKVIMAKGVSICMSGPGYSVCGVKDTQRLTYSGEYLHSAPWNVHHIADGIDSSNGCTNLLPGDAVKLYKLLEVGDVVSYEHTGGPQMSIQNGYGDWNIPWPQWVRGGAVSTR